ncbi:MAG: hypothetical protein ABI592_15635, partial [Acidobacteriota bacterium]
ILGALPHDDRSILLARLWVFARTLVILFGLLFLPSGVTTLVREGPAAAGAYLLGAGFACLATSVAGLYIGVAILAIFGRAAFERVMPWLQIGFQFSYFIFAGGGRFVRLMKQTSVPPRAAWAFPVFWFLAPLEALRRGGFTPALAGRTLLASAAVVALVAGGTRWLGSRVGERLLEPLERRPRPPRRDVRHSGAARAFRLSRLFRSAESRRLFDLLRVHLKGDWRARSEFLMGPVLCGIILFTSLRQGGVWTGIGLVGWLLVASSDVLTRSRRPEVLWFLLVSPMDRARFSAGTVTLMRVFQLLPMFLIFAVREFSQLGMGLLDRLLFLAELAAYGDLLILAGRALFPEFPFSRPLRAEEQMSGRRMALLLIGGLVSGLSTAVLYVFGRWGRPGTLAAIALLVAARFPAASWMRRRVAAAAEGLELEASSAA